MKPNAIKCRQVKFIKHIVHLVPLLFKTVDNGMSNQNDELLSSSSTADVTSNVKKVVLYGLKSESGMLLNGRIGTVVGT